jgi:hypothetical protein
MELYWRALSAIFKWPCSKSRAPPIHHNAVKPVEMLCGMGRRAQTTDCDVSRTGAVEPARADL